MNPMMANEDLSSVDDLIPNASEYRQVVGSLQYLTLTRPNIQFSVNKLSQFLVSQWQVQEGPPLPFQDTMLWDRTE